MYKCFFVRFPLCSGNIKLYSPYLMDHESNPDMPLLADGKIVFFKTKNSAINFMHNHFRNVSYTDEPAYEFDTETFIKNVRTGYQRGIVIDILNIIFDYLSAIKVENYPFFSRKIQKCGSHRTNRQPHLLSLQSPPQMVWTPRQISPPFFGVTN